MTVRPETVPYGAIGLAYIAGLAAYPILPSFAFAGLPYFGLGRPLIAFTLPTAAALTYFILRRFWGETTVGHHSIETNSEAAHRGIAERLIVFIVAVHVLLVLNLAEVQWVRASAPRLVIVLFGGIFIAVGNLLPRTRPNLAFGIRTTRTLNDRNFWIRLHRACGYAAVALGVVIVISGLFLNGAALGPVVGVAAFTSIAAIFVVYWRESHV